jgi:hypothetical protein
MVCKKALVRGSPARAITAAGSRVLSGFGGEAVFGGDGSNGGVVQRLIDDSGEVSFYRWPIRHELTINFFGRLIVAEGGSAS